MKDLIARLRGVEAAAHAAAPGRRVEAVLAALTHVIEELERERIEAAGGTVAAPPVDPEGTGAARNASRNQLSGGEALHVKPKKGS